MLTITNCVLTTVVSLCAVASQLPPVTHWPSDVTTRRYLQGGEMLIGHSGQYYEVGERHRIALLFDERGWRHMDGSTSPGDTPVAKEV